MLEAMKMMILTLCHSKLLIFNSFLMTLDYQYVMLGVLMSVNVLGTIPISGQQEIVLLCQLQAIYIYIAFQLSQLLS